ELSNFEADGCGLPNGFGAYNRIHERSGEPEILESVCFNKCSTCIVSVDEMSVNIFEAYPNPFSDNLTLLLSSQDATELVISDMKGRLVVQKVIPANTPVFNLNTTELSPGTYIVQLVNQGIAQGQVFVKH
ncbi:MAG: T9SS type A sorting domain-containing protein, partial [Bacteroidetes bacterium]|nr:T9SS type A sorting domain-containing protein [Bacteroidota bacterium]